MPLPDDVDPRDLDVEVRKQLKSLSKDTAELVAQHLVVAGRLMDDDPAQALKHARAARALAGRVGAVREANGLVAYTAGEWTEALSELRTARRLTGDPENLPVMADCERALGRPDRALLVAEDPQAKSISPGARVELMIVASGARRDMGQPEAAVASLEVPALEGPVRAWTARLRYAYADALLDAGREDEARSWFGRAAEVDEAGETDADDRVLELDGMVFEDLGGEDDEELDTPEALPVQVEAGEVQVDIEAGTAEVEAGTAELDVQPEPDPPAEQRAGAGDVFSRAQDAAPAPVMSRTGSTGLGFVEPPAAVEEVEEAEQPAAGAEPSFADDRGTAPDGGAPPAGDDLRLFD